MKGSLPFKFRDKETQVQTGYPHILAAPTYEYLDLSSGPTASRFVFRPPTPSLIPSMYVRCNLLPLIKFAGNRKE